ncbi:MAG: cyclic pyranopterin phosphate synthase MoaA [Gammaproteobacteria bacterium RIFOXYA12_FULL_61_12]|nr:MAG: cyclic pyranopterin phosphate synthase MoaA [Gammaproteobacteria bacterium RIFOXYD12_FULL_61_37]OGT92191.1 MAG: cyclic pyranopterin phosphate synthase MoaA [Gammaproteobacteria bacterium RIFOXYA12_FULL_61_12]
MRDSFGREISYLRLSVTDRCDFRCFYCLPRDYRGFATPEHWLSPSEIKCLISVFAGLGIRHVRLTGGEPLVRKELLEITQRIGEVAGIEEISLSTNASRLRQQASELRKMGVSRLNISLDSLDPSTFEKITGGNLSKVLNGIQAAVDVGFHPLKLNMVVMRGINDHEVEKMVDFCMDQGLTLRFIETMPVGRNGIEANRHFIPLREIETRLRQRYSLQPAAMRGSGPARYFQVGGTGLVIGFITPQSQHFCDTCNRVRLSVEGDLHLCLGKENRISLRDMLREGASGDAIAEAIIAGVRLKPERHSFDQPETHVLRPMSALGG